MPHTLAYGRSIDSLDVVLVQDNRGSQAIMRSMISSLRVRRLRVFERAEEALGQMMIDPPHVVVTDWDMKPMSGNRFTRLVRRKAMEPLCFVPIIVAMVNATLSKVDRAFSSGANCVLVKPIAPVTLRRRLEAVTRDTRGFALKGDGYVVAGLEEVLEARVRRNELAEMLRRQRAIQKALTRRPGDEPEAVEGADGDAGGEAPAEAQRQRPVSKSWAMG